MGLFSLGPNCETLTHLDLLNMLMQTENKPYIKDLRDAQTERNSICHGQTDGHVRENQ